MHRGVQILAVLTVGTLAIATLVSQLPDERQFQQREKATETEATAENLRSQIASLKAEDARKEKELEDLRSKLAKLATEGSKEGGGFDPMDLIGKAIVEADDPASILNREQKGLQKFYPYRSVLSVEGTFEQPCIGDNQEYVVAVRVGKREGMTEEHFVEARRLSDGKELFRKEVDSGTTISLANNEVLVVNTRDRFFVRNIPTGDVLFEGERGKRSRYAYSGQSLAFVEKEEDRFFSDSWIVVLQNGAETILEDSRVRKDNRASYNGIWLCSGGKFIVAHSTESQDGEIVEYLSTWKNDGTFLAKERHDDLVEMISSPGDRFFLFTRSGTMLHWSTNEERIVSVDLPDHNGPRPLRWFPGNNGLWLVATEGILAGYPGAAFQSGISPSRIAGYNIVFRNPEGQIFRYRNIANYSPLLLSVGERILLVAMSRGKFDTSLTINEISIPLPKE